MNWIKVIAINFIVFILLISFVEISAGLGRLAIGKPYYTPNIFRSYSDIDDPRHPCNEQKTDALLSHVSNHREKCSIKGGQARGEYVIYDSSGSNKPILLTLGGSTTAGFYQNISTGETWPKLLAEMVSEKYKVVNGGVGGYSSLQELLKFLRDGPRFKNLSVVISLNGINELENYHGREQERAQGYPFLTNIQVKMNRGQVWIDQRLSKAFFGNVMPNITSFFQFYSSKVEELDSLDMKEKELFKPISAADRWETNMRRLNKLVELEGAVFLLFLQPTLGLEGAQSQAPIGSSDYRIMEKTEKQMPDYFEEINSLYKDLKTRCEKMDFCIDLSNIAPPTGDVYGDVRHHNDKGNRTLAAKILEFLS